jgi:hypothetical protein
MILGVLASTNLCYLSSCFAEGVASWGADAVCSPGYASFVHWSYSFVTVVMLLTDQRVIVG